ncbi:hypothetical protein [Nocardia asteroides]|uniref:hypothetical protein n=1 Tax=Nocardia asteroides TaxID=1824 RepID=UPI0033EC113D
MNTDTTRVRGPRRLLLGVAVVGAAVTIPLTAATPALALPASAPDVVQTNQPRCDDWNRYDNWDYCDRDRRHRCDYGYHDQWNDWDRCDRGRGGGYHNWFPWGWFGSS